MARRPWADAVARANATAKQPILFILERGMAPGLWRGWIELVERTGYASVALPGPPASAGGSGLGDAAEEAVGYFSEIAQAFSSRPAVIGQGAGGLIAGELAGACVAAASVVIAPDPPLYRPARSETSSLSRSPVLIITDAESAWPVAAHRDAGWERVAVSGLGRALASRTFHREAADAALLFIQRYV